MNMIRKISLALIFSYSVLGVSQELRADEVTMENWSEGKIKIKIEHMNDPNLALGILSGIIAGSAEARGYDGWSGSSKSKSSGKKPKVSYHTYHLDSGQIKSFGTLDSVSNVEVFRANGSKMDPKKDDDLRLGHTWHVGSHIKVIIGSKKAYDKKHPKKFLGLW